MKKDKKREYSEFQRKITGKFCFSAFVSVLAVMGMYVFLWRKRAGDWIVDILENVGNMPHEDAFMIYHSFFRGNKEILFTIAIIAVFLLLLWRSFRWMTRYFNEIKEGIDSLLCQETEQIILSPEMLPFERKLNAVKQTLEKQKQETALAEQNKDELVVYLAHDIRTPLTSVIGYLNLLEENPEMPTEERMKNVHITLEKAYRLEEMVQELFEITRYHSHQIRLIKEKIDLYYMLVQLSDEMVPVLKKRGNSVILDVDEEMMVFADPDKLARVFSNILKNAAVYSYPVPRSGCLLLKQMPGRQSSFAMKEIRFRNRNCLLCLISFTGWTKPEVLTREVQGWGWLSQKILCFCTRGILPLSVKII